MGGPSKSEESGREEERVPFLNSIQPATSRLSACRRRELREKEAFSSHIRPVLLLRHLSLQEAIVGQVRLSQALFPSCCGK